MYYGFAYSQTAKATSCSEITVSYTPPLTNIYTAGGYNDCDGAPTYYAGCDENGNPACCTVAHWYVTPAIGKFELEKLQDNGSWVMIGDAQFSLIFDNVEQGTYRVKIYPPNIAENRCSTNDYGQPIRSRTCVFNQSGQWVGYMGTYDNSPFDMEYPPVYTNTVYVGPTSQEDISYTFIDEPETGAEIAYDFGETVKIDVSDCKNYNLWWLAIFENGPTFNRYKSNGWTNGTIPGGEIDLTQFWLNNNFETFHQYTVQLVIENSNCRNGIESVTANGWNDLNRSFFICPAETGCKLGIDNREIVISPNPASTMIQLQHFKPDLDRDYVMSITDLAGKDVKNIPLTADRVDISDLKAGMFLVSIFREGERVFNSKLIVSQ